MKKNQLPNQFDKPVNMARINSCIYAFATFYFLYTLTNTYADDIYQQKGLQTVANPFGGIDTVVPFIDWMIVPYSCSLPLFIASFFMVQTQTVLRQLTHRLLLATLIGCLFFYWVPLRFSFDVSAEIVNSPWQWAYHILHEVDKPYNQLPSLHVTYAILLVISLWSSMRSNVSKVALIGLGVSIALSTLFTWQHHFLDVLTGLFLAMLVLAINHYFERQQPVTKSSMIKHLVIAVVGFLSIQILPIVIFSDSTMMMHIIGYYWLTSFTLLAFLYHLHKPDLLRQSKLTKPELAQKNGQLALLSKLVFFPVVGVYQFMWWVASYINVVQIPTPCQRIAINVNGCLTQGHLTQQNRLKQEIDIIATGKVNTANLQKLMPMFHQYEQIIWLDMGCELNGSLENAKDLQQIRLYHLNTPMLDLTAWDEQEHARIFDYCQQLDASLALSQPQQKVLIVTQCVMGWSRSVAMLACVLAYYGMSNQKIKAHVKEKYPKTHIWQILDDALLKHLNLYA